MSSRIPSLRSSVFLQRVAHTHGADIAAECSSVLGGAETLDGFSDIGIIATALRKIRGNDFHESQMLNSTEFNSLSNPE